jgi:hypothetical protein
MACVASNHPQVRDTPHHCRSGKQGERPQSVGCAVEFPGDRYLDEITPEDVSRHRGPKARRS